MSTILRFLALVVILNIVRYLIGGIIEQPLILPNLFAEMEQNPSYFAQEFETVDWATSFFYNFMMWLVTVWVYHLARPSVGGHEIVKSLKVYGILFIFFAGVSFIYMNHYSHPKGFYYWNVLDGAVVFAIVGLANGLLYRRVMKAGEIDEANRHKSS